MNRMYTSLPVLALFLTLAPVSLASNTWYVDGGNGNDSNNCMAASSACRTIGHAISLAGSGDSILVAPAIYHEHITVSFDLTLIGSAADTTIIDGSGAGTVVSISNQNANVVLSDLTVQNGTPSGIYNIGTLGLINSTVRNNYVYKNCINYCLGIGAGIRNVTGKITITNSTIANNSIHISCSPSSYPHLCMAFGGGISNEGGHLAIVNSTFAGNSVSGSNSGQPFGCCGAISESGSSYSLTISSSAIAGNSATKIGGIIGVSTVISNSIVANNIGGNCSAPMVSNGYNLSSDGTCNFSGAGDLNNVDPKLGPLQSNGGPTQTMALLPGSPAIDAGNPAGCVDAHGQLLKTDQRGMPRPDREDTFGCDIGAYESQSDQP